MALHAKTELLTSQGEIRTANSLRVGDHLMGPDSAPRKIIKLLKVTREGVKIVPPNGRSIICDEEQIIPLFKPGYLNNPFHYIKKGIKRAKHKFAAYPPHFNVRVEDILKSSIHKFGRRFLLYQVPLKYSPQDVSIPPYYFGLWLGDGYEGRPSITTADKEIVYYIYMVAEKYGLKVSINTKVNNKASSYTIVRGNVKKSTYSGDKNPLQTQLRELGVLGNKHIPPSYLKNSREVRLALLAGLIDSDGTLQGNVYHITQKSEILASQIMLLANSLGFRSVIARIQKGIKEWGFVGNYYSVSISGPLNQIPVVLPRKKIKKISTRHNRLLKGFIAQPMNEIENMVAIEVEGDGQFLLGDCTVMGGRKFYDSMESYEKDFYVDRRWSKSFVALENFVKRMQRLPSYKFSNESSLLNWIGDNIENAKKGILKKEKVDMLKALGVDFNYHESLFLRQFNNLVKFREIFPDKWPVHRQEYPAGNQLGEWCKGKRKAYRRGKLSDWQVEKLKSIGFPFTNAWMK